MITQKLALLAVVLAVVGGLVVTTIGSTTHAGNSIVLSVVPPARTEADAVRIEVTGSLPTPCYDVSSSHVLTGNSIVVTVDIVPVGTHCILVVGSFSVSEEVGQLANGSYSVQATVNVPCCYPCDPSPCVLTTTFEVGGPTPTITLTPTVTPTPTPGGPEMALRVGSGGFCEPLDPTECHAQLGDPFVVSLDAVVAPANGYTLAQGWISYGDDLGAVKQESAAWPDCFEPFYLTTSTDEGGSTNLDTYYVFCLTGIPPPDPASFHLGPLFTFTLTCTNTFSSNILEIIPQGVEPAGVYGAVYLDPDEVQVVPKVRSITVTCEHLKPEPEPSDADGDGCSDLREFGPDETLGGQRNFLNPHDFYDTNGDGIIDLTNDIFDVIMHYAPMGTEPEYDVGFDRGPSEGPNVWNMTAPDGVIDLSNDIMGVIQQYFHSCQ